MVKNYFKTALIGAVAICSIPVAVAKTGAPHTLSATSEFDAVTISWQAPDAAKDLKWHNGRDWNGDSAEPQSPQSPQRFYAGSLFTATDLVNLVGETIDSVSFFQYRPVYSATIVVFENGVKVSETTADPSKYVKNSWLKVGLTTPVTIKADTDYRVAVLWEAGSNMDFVALKDNSTAGTGRGDQYSLDGVNWVSTADGSYLVTAHLTNDVDETPTSYDIYRDGTKLDSTTGNSVVLTEQPEGNHLYAVHAVYAETQHASYDVPVYVRPLESTLPSVTMGSASVSDLDVTINWVTPLKGGNTLTWNDAELASSIGGTASSNTKVWIKNEFTSTDLIGYIGGQITSISAYFSEDCINGATAWVMRNDTIIAYKEVSDSIITDFETGWLSVALDEPVTIERGNKYSYGVYVLHTPKQHPIAIGGSIAVVGKGNVFSTSSPNSKDFAKSKPSFKNLTDGGIEGNWMLTADIANAPTPLSDFTYDVYRDGTLLKSGVTETQYSETVEDLGRYVYSVVTRNAAGLESDHIKKVVNVSLPEAYAAPTLEETEFDTETRTVTLNWSTNKVLTKAGEATYVVGFDEELTMHWGQQFTADELAAYEGQYIKKLSFIVGEGITNLKIGVYTSNGTPLYQQELPETIAPYASYFITLTEPVAITGTEDLILAYSGTLAAGSSPIVIDAGPLKTNGARVSLTGGSMWMNLGTINPTYNNYNVVIGALVGEPDTESTPARAKRAIISANDLEQADLIPLVRSVNAREPEIEVLKNATPARAPQAKPVISSFNVYRNGVVVANTTNKTYTETLDKFNEFKYYITAVYNNGWESAASDSYTVKNRIDQRTIAPYGLTGSVEGDDLALTWQAPDAATTLTYAPEDETIQGLGLTASSSTVNSYVANLYSVETLEPYVGNKIDHIQFGLADVNVNSLSVIVIIGENVVYSQSVPTSKLVAGINDVRLNEPFEIPAGVAVGVGFTANYEVGVKPLPMASNTAVEGYSDLISANATPGYWYSLKKKYNFDRTFWFKAILSTNDQIVKAKAATPTSYNVYCDGTLIAEGVTEPAYTVENATSGQYYVTAVDAEGTESGTSNKVIYSGTTSVEDIIVAGDSEAEYYDLNGRRIEPEAGTVVIRRQGNTATKVVVK